MQNMSLVILTDEVLADQTCDKCYKYLSVKPIMTGRKKILCGRCVNGEDGELAESCYNVFAKHVLFKCINRFEGCHKLLTINQVVNHEKICKTHSYVCLLCQASDSPPPPVPSFMFPNHMKTCHKKYYIKSDIIKIYLDPIQSNTYFCQKDDYLFFIQVVFNKAEKCAAITTYYIGDRQSKVYHKYYLQKENAWIETQKQLCHYIKSISNNDPLVLSVNDVEEDQKFLTLRAEFEIPAFSQLLEYDPSLIISQSSVNTFNSNSSINTIHNFSPNDQSPFKIETPPFFSPNPVPNLKEPSPSFSFSPNQTAQRFWASGVRRQK